MNTMPRFIVCVFVSIFCPVDFMDWFYGAASVGFDVIIAMGLWLIYMVIFYCYLPPKKSVPLTGFALECYCPENVYCQISKDQN